MLQHPDPPDCMCGHPWDEHHHGCIMNPAWPTEKHDFGICSGIGPQECEWTRVNGCRIRENEPECKCNNYRNSRTGLSSYQAEGLEDDDGYGK